MKRRCRVLRERALKAGIDSPEASVWRIHSRSCPDCQTEHFLLEALQRQAQTQRQHLGRAEVDELLEAARQHHGRRQRPRVLRRWAWRAASVCLLVGVTWHLNQTDSVRNVVESAPVQLLTQAADEACGYYGIPVLSARSEHDRTIDQMAIAPASPAQRPTAVPEFFPLDRLLNIREEVEQRRDQIIELYETDLGDRDRDGAWEMVLPQHLAVA